MAEVDRYVFPAVFDLSEEGGYTVTFPDLPGCITEGDTEEESFQMAKEALELHLYGMERDGDEIPKPSKVADIALEKGQLATLIEVWMPLVRDEQANRSVKKTLTIPKWLNDLAEQKHVNFSHVLQTALKGYLGVDRKFQGP
jgi:predicted RNase H-like HicB family nuclease